MIGLHKEGVFNKNSNNYNKGIFLNYPIKEFIKLNYNKRIDINENEMLLKEFNKKYNLNIKDTKINKLELSLKILGDEGLKYLCKIEFKELKELNLSANNITDIKSLEKAKFEKLEKLNLSYNNISNIDILEKLNFKELKELDLSSNNISDIKVLEKVNFKQLKILNLSLNKVLDNKILNKLNFKELKNLILDENIINNSNHRYQTPKKRKNERFKFIKTQFRTVNSRKNSSSFKPIYKKSIFNNKIDIKKIGKIKENQNKNPIIYIKNIQNNIHNNINKLSPIIEEKYHNELFYNSSLNNINYISHKKIYNKTIEQNNNIDQRNGGIVNINFELMNLKKKKTINNKGNLNSKRRLNKFEKTKEIDKNKNKNISLIKLQNSASSQIQAVWRGYSTRIIMKLYNHLDEFIYHISKVQINTFICNFHFFMNQLFSIYHESFVNCNIEGNEEIENKEFIHKNNIIINDKRLITEIKKLESEVHKFDKNIIYKCTHKFNKSKK